MLPVATYDSESWTLRTTEKKRLEAFEMSMMVRVDSSSMVKTCAAKFCMDSADAAREWIRNSCDTHECALAAEVTVARCTVTLCNSVILCPTVQTVIVSKTVACLSVAQMHATGVTEAVCAIFDPGLGTLSTSLAPFISCQQMFWRWCGKHALRT